MRRILLLPFLFFFLISSGQKFQLKIENVNFEFIPNKISNNSCLDSSSLAFKPFYDKEKKVLVYLPPIEEIYNFPNEEEKTSILYRLEWDENPLIITITKYPISGITLKEFFFKEYMGISQFIGQKYDLGVENICGNEIFWIKELIPDSEFGAYSTLFYLYNKEKEEIYMVDFSTFKKPNCRVNGLMINVLSSITW